MMFRAVCYREVVSHDQTPLALASEFGSLMLRRNRCQQMG